MVLKEVWLYCLTSLSAPTSNVDGMLMSDTSTLVWKVTCVGRGLRMVTRCEVLLRTGVLRSIVDMIPGEVALKVTL